MQRCRSRAEPISKLVNLNKKKKKEKCKKKSQFSSITVRKLISELLNLFELFGKYSDFSRLFKCLDLNRGPVDLCSLEIQTNTALFSS